MKLETRTPTINVPIEDVEDIAKLRGLPADILAEYGIRIAGPDTERPGWIEIPYPHMTGVWYSRFRNTSDTGHKYHSPRGCVAHLYNPLKLGPNADEVWIAEGEFDTLALIAAGVPAVGVSGVSAFKPEWAPLFSEADVVVAFDADIPGQEAAHALSVRLSSANGFRDSVVFEWPKKVVDVLGSDADWNGWWKHDSAGMVEFLWGWREEYGLGKEGTP